MAGMGHYSFINQLDEIEKKVVAALAKDFLDYLKIQTIKLYNKEGSELISIEKPGDVSYGQYFSYGNIF